MIEICEIHQKIAQKLCGKIIKDLPEYFGLPDANEEYISGVKKNKNYAAKVDGRFVGLISICTPYANNANIYWVAVFRKYQSKNIGNNLIKTAFNYAIKNNIKTITVETLAPNNADKNYMRTYSFYISKGFLPLFNLKPQGYKWEMVYMLKKL